MCVTGLKDIFEECPKSLNYITRIKEKFFIRVNSIMGPFLTLQDISENV